MKKHAAALFVFIFVVGVTACHGGSHGGFLPPSNVSRHTQAVAQPAVAQWTSGASFAPASITVSWASAPAAGDVLVVSFWNNGQTSGSANTYTPPAGWTQIDQNIAHAYATYQSFSHVVAAGEANSYVFTPSAAQREHVWLGADVSNAGAVDVSGNAYISSSTTYTTPSVTPTQNTDIALAFNMPFKSGLTWTNPAGWSAGTSVSQWTGESLFQQLASNASTSETATLSSAATGFAAIVLVSASGVSATPTPTPTPTATPTATPTPTPTPGGGGGGTAPSAMQWTSGAKYAPATITISYPTAPAAGDLLVIAFLNNGQTSGSSNTYTPPAGWNQVDLNNSHGFATYQSFAHVVGVSETNSYVFTPQQAAREHVYIAGEFANAAGIDKASDVYNASTTTYTSPALAPAQANELALVFNLPFASSTATWTNPAAPWTLGTGPTSQWRGEALYETESSTAPVSETSTLSAAATGFSAMVLIDPGNATPTPPPTPTPVPTATPQVAYTDVSTFGYDLGRTGNNPHETTLSASNVTSTSLQQIWQTPPDLGAAITAEPILATNVAVPPNNTPTNLLYIGAENNVFYAINADTGAVVWKNTTLGSAVSLGCGDLPGGQFGITGTATYDRNAGVVYVADATDHVSALSMATGAVQWSVNVLTDPNTNTIVGSSTQDHIYSALTLNPVNGMLYVETASFCDNAPWHGRIVAINTATHTVAAAFFPGRPNGGQSAATAYCGGGIWGMGGASIDSTGDVYVATGNIVTSSCGGFTNGGGETNPYGDAVVQLDPNLNLLSFATANVNGTKVSGDSDYGATPMLYSVPNCASLQVSAKNKNGYLYTYAVGASSLTAEQQLHVGNSNGNGIFIGVPAFDPSAQSQLLFVGDPNANGNFAHGLNALQETSGGCTGLTLDWKASIGSVNITSNDNQAPTTANGVVYFTSGVDDKVYAFNDASLVPPGGNALWNSGTTIGGTCSYGTTCGVFGAALVDGHIYVGSWNHKLYAFGL